MRKWFRLTLLSCYLAAGFATNNLGSPPDSRAERLRKERREHTELDREWRLKYEDEWKAYLRANERSYRRWEITKLEDRKKYQMDRLSRKLPRIPFRLLHR